MTMKIFKWKKKKTKIARNKSCQSLAAYSRKNITNLFLKKPKNITNLFLMKRKSFGTIKCDFCVVRLKSHQKKRTARRYF